MPGSQPSRQSASQPSEGRHTHVIVSTLPVLYKDHTKLAKLPNYMYREEDSYILKWEFLVYFRCIGKQCLRCERTLLLSQRPNLFIKTLPKLNFRRKFQWKWFQSDWRKFSGLIFVLARPHQNPVHLGSKRQKNSDLKCHFQSIKLTLIMNSVT